MLRALAIFAIILFLAASTSNSSRGYLTLAQDSGRGSISSTVRRFYADNSFWNIPIPPNPAIDSNSSNIVKTAFAPYQSRANFANTEAWGISLVTTPPPSKTYTIICKKYGCGNTITFPIPRRALPNTGSDNHLVVINGTQELDLWLASYDSKKDTWSAGSRYISDLYGWGACGPPGTHCDGAVAAGFAEMGGVVRPEEIQQGHIDHALSLATPYTRASYIACPATHTDGKYGDSNAIPEGAQIQLDPTFDVGAQSWPQWEKIIAKALQTYGAYISDTSGTVAIYGQSDMNAGNVSWNSVGVPKSKNGQSMANLPWNRFRVLALKSCN